MPLTAHLLELRRRLLSSLAAIAVMAAAAWCCYPWLVPHLLSPLNAFDSHAPISGLNFRTVLSPLTTRLYLSAWGGLIAASPWWIAQGWLFVAPALESRQRRRIAYLSTAGAALFLLGAGAAWLFLPRALALLLSEVPPGAGALLDMDSYLTFVVILTLVMGCSALFPLLIVGAHALGLVTVRTLIMRWRWAIMAAFTFAAITNPLPDLWSFFLQAGILLSLYCAAVALCALRQWWRCARHKQWWPYLREALTRRKTPHTSQATQAHTAEKHLARNGHEEVS